LSFASNPARIPLVRFSLNHQSGVTILLYDVSGRLVREIPAGEKSPGNYNIDIGPVNAGIYFCKLKTDQEEVVEKLVVID
jgi:hypothetical protein